MAGIKGMKRGVRKKYIPHPDDRSNLTLPDTQVCIECHEKKPHTAFQLANYAHRTTLQLTCIECIRAKRMIKYGTGEMGTKISRGKFISNVITGMLLENNEEALMDMCATVIKLARGGDPRMIELVFDRIEGKVKEVVEIKADDATKQLVSDASALMDQIRKNKPDHLIVDAEVVEEIIDKVDNK